MRGPYNGVIGDTAQPDILTGFCEAPYIYKWLGLRILRSTFLMQSIPVYRLSKQAYVIVCPGDYAIVTYQIAAASPHLFLGPSLS